MLVRHFVAAENVDGDFIIDPARVRHGTIVAGKIDAIAGEIDSATHLNLDFAEHRLDGATVVAALVAGADVLRDVEGLFASACIRSGERRRLGVVDTGARRVAWLEVLRERRTGGRPARERP